MEECGKFYLVNLHLVKQPKYPLHRWLGAPDTIRVWW